MKKAVLSLMIIAALIAAMAPILSAAGGAPCGPNTPNNPVMPTSPQNWASPVIYMPLFVTAMQETNALAEQLQAALEGIEDPSQYAEQIQAISEQIALAAQGANFVHKKDQVLVAKQMLEDLLATL